MTTTAPRAIVKPEPGWFRTRMVRKGPWVPARIYCEPATDPLTGELMERPAMLLAEINGRPCEPERVWQFCWPITEDEYRFMLANIAWAEQHAPRDPAANPERAIDLNAIGSLF